ncbi:asparaginase [Plasticicumulans acidivorans]|uniref:asparaginase n=1 Tax=Plasticicumulans acidivorans TaxID=886464 RepID=A0A317MYD5_9GAMM|nr:asparaginase [Plasticicumulans acidivorans]PWV64372.1 asparaginase [Plasticicumulans acidivorans]
MKPRVWVAYTGGTIGMVPSASGYVPAPGFLARLRQALPQLDAPTVPDFELYEYAELLDSANMRPDDWNRIAADIAARHDAYDGFVVLHGTDTMAYTASALSFMLEGLRKPVILTGSQIPLCEPRNDARDNLLDALILAGHCGIAEVCVAFNGVLLRGNRTTKVKAEGLGAFESPNLPPLAELGIDIRIHRERVRAPAALPFRLRPFGDAEVAALRLFPGIRADFLRRALAEPLAGLVLEAYGAGNGPARDPDVLAALTQASARGVVIVVVTQCLEGRAELGTYAAGSALAAAGCVGGQDMTAEAALTKLAYLFAEGLSAAEVRAAIRCDLRGELSAG